MNKYFQVLDLLNSNFHRIFSILLIIAIINLGSEDLGLTCISLGALGILNFSVLLTHRLNRNFHQLIIEKQVIYRSLFVCNWLIINLLVFRFTLNNYNHKFPFILGLLIIYLMNLFLNQHQKQKVELIFEGMLLLSYNFLIDISDGIILLNMCYYILSLVMASSIIYKQEVSEQIHKYSHLILIYVYSGLFVMSVLEVYYMIHMSIGNQVANFAIAIMIFVILKYLWQQRYQVSKSALLNLLFVGELIIFNYVESIDLPNGLIVVSAVFFLGLSITNIDWLLLDRVNKTLIFTGGKDE